MAEHWIPNPAVGGSSPSARDRHVTIQLDLKMLVSGYKTKQGRPSRQIALCVSTGCLSWLTIQIASMFVARQAGLFWLTLCISASVVSALLSMFILEKPKFSDFLISVQSEIDKVTWPSTEEVKRATLVVLVLIISMACVMFFFDLVWQWVFQVIGFLQIYRR